MYIDIKAGQARLQEPFVQLLPLRSQLITEYPASVAMPPKSRPSTNTTSKPKTKFTPRPPISPEEKLKKLYAGLVDQINEGYYDNAVRTCRKSEYQGDFSVLDWARLSIYLQPGSC